MSNPGTTLAAPVTSTLTAHLKDANDRVILATVTGGVPPTTANLFAKGAICLRTDSATGISGWYQNNGTSAAPVWDLVGPSAAGILNLGGIKIASGERTQVAASDTVVSGLATVSAVIVTPRTRTLKQLFFNGSIGDQAGTPAAGSFLITSQKPTAANDTTPVAATDFTDAIKVNWIAIGT